MTTKSLLEYLDETNTSIAECIFDKIIAPTVKSSPLKSEKMAIEQGRQEAIELVKKGQEDIRKGFELFLNSVTNNEKDQFDIIINKILDNMFRLKDDLPLVEITFEDLKFLEKIAKRELNGLHFSDSSCMFRFILQMGLDYSPAWVGWALSEWEFGHKDIVDHIFELGLALLPTDYFLCNFAVYVYMQDDRQTKALEILDNAIRHLQTHEIETKYRFEKLIAKIQGGTL